jgi:spoIIIJ-associated protein
VEWVEATGRTIEEAKERALERLGVSEDEAEVYVIKDSRRGWFGRVRSEARVRARVRPAPVPPKVGEHGRRERRQRRGERQRRGTSSDADGKGREARRAPTGEGRNGRNDRSGGAPRGGRERSEMGNEPTGRTEASSTERGGPAGRSERDSPAGDTAAFRTGQGEGEPGEDLDAGGSAPEPPASEQAQVAAEFLRGLVACFGKRATVEAAPVDEASVLVNVDGEGLGILVGPRGATLEAVQELTRTVVQRRTRARRTRLYVDVGRYRERRAAALERFVRDVAAQVLASGTARVLEPMRPADRKIVHDTVNAIPGVVTRSEGEDPLRRVVILPEGPQAAAPPPTGVAEEPLPHEPAGRRSEQVDAGRGGGGIPGGDDGS